MAARMRFSAIAAVLLALIVTVACVQTADGAKPPCKPRSCPTPTTPTPTTSTATSTPPTVSPQPVLAYYNRYSNGPRYATTDFPYGVWLQDPSKYDGDVGRQYKALGVNTYVGQWTWPASSYAGHAQAVQNALAANGAQAFGRFSTQSVQQARTLNGDRFRGWLLEDEPDMRGITEEQLASQAAQAHTADPSRPTYVNFSKGIVNGYNGSRPLTAQDKREYCASADIASVDFYGFTDPWEGRPGAPGYARAMDAMRAACGDRPIWAFVETTRPFDGSRITPDQFEVAVWTLLASGADGIELFIHDFGPGGIGEDALLRDPAAAAVKARVGVVGAQLRAAAPLLHQGDKPASSSNSNVRVLGKPGGVVAVNLTTAPQTTTVSCAGITVTQTFLAYEHRILPGTC